MSRRRSLLAIALVLGVLVAAYVGPVRGLIDARSEHAGAVVRLERAQAARDRVEAQVRNLREPGRLEQEARRLGLARPGETMVMVAPRP